MPESFWDRLERIMHATIAAGFIYFGTQQDDQWLGIPTTFVGVAFTCFAAWSKRS